MLTIGDIGLLAAARTSALVGVANIGSTTTRSSASNSPAGNSGPPTSAAMARAQLAYSTCIRSHGVPDFPGPGGGFERSDMARVDRTHHSACLV